jgi:IclR family acetate operon transcriptional repressor
VLQSFTPCSITDSLAQKADLSVIRTRGFALDDKERNDGIRCIAAAVFDSTGEPVAGISVSGPTSRIDADAMQRLSRGLAIGGQAGPDLFQA